MYQLFPSQSLAEPVFVNLLKSPEIDSQPSWPAQQPYLSYQPTRLQRQAESIPRKQFLGSLNVYKYGLWSKPSSTLSATTVFLLQHSGEFLTKWRGLALSLDRCSVLDKTKVPQLRLWQQINRTLHQRSEHQRAPDQLLYKSTKPRWCIEHYTNKYAPQINCSIDQHNPVDVQSIILTNMLLRSTAPHINKYS